MSFGDGNLKEQNKQLKMVIGFMLDRLFALDYGKTNPASWSYIIRELRKAGIEVER